MRRRKVIRASVSSLALAPLDEPTPDSRTILSRSLPEDGFGELVESAGARLLD
jgi:hypothetical protein